MAESVKATLDKEGLTHVPVYRLAQEAIGCSLAESAESPAYHAWLNKAAAKASSEGVRCRRCCVPAQGLFQLLQG